MLIHHVRSFSRKKCFGFTLVEFMVAFSIMTILATIGFSAYTGYMKWSRDTGRMVDIATMDGIIFDFRQTNGRPPVSEEEFNSAVIRVNHGQLIMDPLDAQVACVTSATDDALTYCGYVFSTCDNGEGYILSAKFETTTRAQYYRAMPGAPTSEWFYTVGQCTVIDIPELSSIPDGGHCRHKDECLPNRVCVGPPNKTCRPKNNQNT